MSFCIVCESPVKFKCSKCKAKVYCSKQCGSKDFLTNEYGHKFYCDAIENFTLIGNQLLDEFEQYESILSVVFNSLKQLQTNTKRAVKSNPDLTLNQVFEANISEAKSQINKLVRSRDPYGDLGVKLQPLIELLEQIDNIFDGSVEAIAKSQKAFENNNIKLANAIKSLKTAEELRKKLEPRIEELKNRSAMAIKKFQDELEDFVSKNQRLIDSYPDPELKTILENANSKESSDWNGDQVLEFLVELEKITQLFARKILFLEKTKQFTFKGLLEAQAEIKSLNKDKKLLKLLKNLIETGQEILDNNEKNQFKKTKDEQSLIDEALIFLKLAANIIQNSKYEIDSQLGENVQLGSFVLQEEERWFKEFTDKIIDGLKTVDIDEVRKYLFVYTNIRYSTLAWSQNYYFDGVKEQDKYLVLRYIDEMTEGVFQDLGDWDFISIESDDPFMQIESAIRKLQPIETDRKKLKRQEVIDDAINELVEFFEAMGNSRFDFFEVLASQKTIFKKRVGSYENVNYVNGKDRVTFYRTIRAATLSEKYYPQITAESIKTTGEVYQKLIGILQNQVDDYDFDYEDWAKDEISSLNNTPLDTVDTVFEFEKVEKLLRDNGIVDENNNAMIESLFEIDENCNNLSSVELIFDNKAANAFLNFLNSAGVYAHKLSQNDNNGEQAKISKIFVPLSKNKLDAYLLLLKQ